MSDSEIRQLMQKAEEEESREVDRLYSTKPIRFRMAGRQYVVPVNYFTPKGRDRPGGGESKGFGFFLFLPDFVGYTKKNWRNPFDRHLIKVIQINPIDRNAMVPYAGGGYAKVTPANYGDPRAQFENRRKSLEERASFKLYNLEGYRWKNPKIEGVTWIGTRSNGEFFFFGSTLAPGDVLKAGLINPLCNVRYYSEKEDLFISYRYSQDNIEQWRAIDDGIWTRLHSWQLK